MYRIPADLNLDDIIGSEIHQICLGRYDVQFSFGSKTRIAVQSLVTLLENDEVIATWDDKTNWTSLAFQRLLNESIEGYAIPNDRILEIRFCGGLVLQPHDDSDQFESMQIYSQGAAVGALVI